MPTSSRARPARPRATRRAAAVAVLTGLVALALGAWLLVRGEPADRVGRRLTEPVAAALADELGTADDGAVDAPPGPAYVVLRAAGREVAAGWGGADDTPALSALRAALDEAVEEAGDDVGDVDAVEVVLAHDLRPVRLDDPLPAELDNVHRGVRGLELRRGDDVARYSPTWMLATNRGFARVVELWAAEHGVDDVADPDAGVRARVFDAEQFLVLLDQGEASVRRMFRGNRVVQPDEVTARTVEATARRLGDWLAGAVHPDGRIVYQWFPSRGEESDANNSVRQWMATAALGRYAAWRDDERLWERSRRNLAYNLRASYVEQDGLGLIQEGPDKVKLGAVAVAGRALAEHPDRDRLASTLAALEATTVHLARPDGSFRTWYRPAERDDQHNFYPGEALYLWAHRYAERRDPQTLERILRAFAHYRRWHLDNRNPAFVPWHTQAYVETWRAHPSAELAAFVFEMNDWLLAMQQWDDVAYPDLRGRFYDPDHPEYGPPHASSTGVYLEGLADAFWLARELGEHERAERYRRAILRGVRSVLQLEFADEVDLYYVAERDRVRGGVRTEVYDNRVRVDNVQHNLMALLKVLERFTPADYRH